MREATDSARLRLRMPKTREGYQSTLVRPATLLLVGDPLGFLVGLRLVDGLQGHQND